MLGDLPPKPPAEIDGEAPPARETPDPSADASAEPSTHVDPVPASADVEPARIAEPEPPELGTDNAAYQEIAAKYRKPVVGDAAAEDQFAASDSAVVS